MINYINYRTCWSLRINFIMATITSFP